MTAVLWQLVFDGVIAVLLLVTIVFAARLSLHLKAFRNSRKEIEEQIKLLSGHIERAESAIDGLRENAREAGRDLQASIKEASALSDELQLMTDSGGKLADRLDKAMDKGRAQGVSRAESAVDIENYREKREDIRQQRDEQARQSGKMFSIRDPEFEREDDGVNESADESGLLDGDYQEDEHAGEIRSRAEEELYEALQRKRDSSKTEAGGVS